MMKRDKDRMNLRILEMLRSKGAPAMSPFPGEQDFESEDIDLDKTGDVVAASGASPQLSPKRRKRKRRPEDFVAAQEPVNIIGKT